MSKTFDASARKSRLAARKGISDEEQKSENSVNFRDLVNDLILTSDRFDRAFLTTLLDHLKVLDEDGLLSCYSFIWSKLEQKHSQVRWMCVQLLDELFLRSARIRRWLVRDLQEFVNLTICPPSGELPAPSSFAFLLRNKSISCIIDWKTKFVNRYKKLQLCYEMLQSDMKEMFEQVVAKKKQMEDYQADKRLMEQRKQMKSIQSAIASFRELEDELKMNLTQAQECIALLSEYKRTSVNSKLAETSNNRPVVTSLDESASFLRNQALPKLQSITAKLTCSPFAKQTVAADTTLQKTFTDVKCFEQRVQETIVRVDQLGILRIKSSVVPENLKRTNSKSKDGKTDSRSLTESTDHRSIQSSTHHPSSSANESKKRKMEEESVESSEGSDDSLESCDDLDDVPEKEGIEFMNYSDIAKSVGEASEQQGPSGSSSVQFSLPNPELNTETSSSQKRKYQRRKKKKLISKKSLKETSRQRLAKKMRQKKL